MYTNIQNKLNHVSSANKLTSPQNFVDLAAFNGRRGGLCVDAQVSTTSIMTPSFNHDDLSRIPAEHMMGTMHRDWSQNSNGLTPARRIERESNEAARLKEGEPILLDTHTEVESTPVRMDAVRQFDQPSHKPNNLIDSHQSKVVFREQGPARGTVTLGIPSPFIFPVDEVVFM